MDELDVQSNESIHSTVQVLGGPSASLVLAAQAGARPRRCGPAPCHSPAVLPPPPPRLSQDCHPGSPPSSCTGPAIRGDRRAAARPDTDFTWRTAKRPTRRGSGGGGWLRHGLARRACARPCLLGADSDAPPVSAQRGRWNVAAGAEAAYRYVSVPVFARQAVSEGACTGSSDSARSCHSSQCVSGGTAEDP